MKYRCHERLRWKESAAGDEIHEESTGCTNSILVVP